MLWSVPLWFMRYVYKFNSPALCFSLINLFSRLLIWIYMLVPCLRGHCFYIIVNCMVLKTQTYKGNGLLHWKLVCLFVWAFNTTNTVFFFTKHCFLFTSHKRDAGLDDLDFKLDIWFLLVTGLFEFFKSKRFKKKKNLFISGTICDWNLLGMMKLICSFHELFGRPDCTFMFY